MSGRINLGKLCLAIPWSALQYNNVIPPAGFLAVPTINWKLKSFSDLAGQSVKVTAGDDGEAALCFKELD